MLLFVIACLSFFSISAYAIPLDPGVTCTPGCVCEQDPSYTSGSCSGGCDCTVTCDGVTCVADCICISVEEDEEIEHEDELVFDEIAENERDIEDTGMMGTTEGTFADYEEIYIVDGETAITNEVDITPSWCD